MTYKVYFSDNSVYENNNPIENLDWRFVPKKQIKKVEYLLPNETIVLEDFSEYIIITEYSIDIYGNFKVTNKIEKVFVVGSKGNIVTAYEISIEISNGKYKYGNIKKYKCPRGKEFYGRPILNGWRGGE